MNIPEFTAQASLYRTSRQYVTSASNGFESTPTRSVVAQNGERFAGCDACEVSCNWTNVKCQASASAIYAIAAVGCGAIVFPPAVAVCEGIAATVYAGAIGLCYAWVGECLIECWVPGGKCCPVFCELGHCCSEGETCIPHGCCPNDQTICNGECCAKGYSCCGDTCCPPHYYCLDGGFCSEFPSSIPFGNPPPPPPPRRPPPSVLCIRKEDTPCGNTCCPPGLECCYDRFTNTGVCKTSCGPS
jgi:hypothetical protein